MQVLTLWMIWVIPLVWTQKESCQWIDSFGKAGHRASKTYLTTNYDVLTFDQCKHLCSQTLHCVAVDWRQYPRQCDLYKGTPYLMDDKLYVYSVKSCVMEGCTRLKRWCAHDAVCVNQTCVCPHHAPKGDPTVDCVPKDKEVCLVDCDPKTFTWDGAVVPINLPCWYRVTEFFVYSSALKYNYNKCRVQVYALNQLTVKGLFFVKRVLINLWLGRATPTGQYSWPKFISHVIDIDHDLVWKAIKGESTIFDVMPLKQLLDLEIRRSIDRQHRFATVTFKQCHVQIKFRPYDPDHQPQTHKPGVSIAVPNHTEFSLKYGAGDQHLSTVCLKPGLGPDIYEQLAWYLGLSSGAQAILHNIFLMGADVQNTDKTHEHGHQCMEVVKVFTSPECEPHRALTLRLCSPILNRRKFIRCLKSAGKNPMDILLSCVHWGCLGDEVECQNYTYHLTHFCSLTRFMERLACNRLLRLEISQKIRDRRSHH